jgi:hypothetical protein
MSRARSAIAARTSLEALKAAACKAYGYTPYETAEFEEFYDAAQFCRANSEELGGDEGTESWYVWEHEGWAVLGDLTLDLARNNDALNAISKALDAELIVGGIDLNYGFAVFGAFTNGEATRFLKLEDDDIEDEGVLLKAERGRPLVDFNEEEAGRLWNSFGLPTFDHDPLDGRFVCTAVKAG